MAMMGLLLTAAAAVSNFQNVSVVRVTDGDTMVVSLPGVPEVFGRAVPVRIRGIDSAEIKDLRACARRDALASRLAMLTLTTNARLDLNYCKRDKFFRLLCDGLVNGKTDLTAYQLANKNAVPYDGRKKPTWVCIKP